MAKMIILILSLLSYPPISGMTQEKKSEVLIISTIHGTHRTNPNYTYDTLFKFIEAYNPEIIGVEIRAEDIDSSFTYLKRNYPFEMYECIRIYPAKRISGVDWLGSDLEGKAIPLLGADHRDYTLKKVSDEMGSQILLNHYKLR